jgi:hypothetical protein
MGWDEKRNWCMRYQTKKHFAVAICLCYRIKKASHIDIIRFQIKGASFGLGLRNSLLPLPLSHAG